MLPLQHLKQKSENFIMSAKQLRLRLRDLKNKITGKDKVIEKYNETTHKIATLSDKEKNPDVKKKLMELYEKVTDEKWHTDDNVAWSDSYNPYKGRKKTTRSKIELAETGLKQIMDNQHER